MTRISRSKFHPNRGIGHSGISKNWWIITRSPSRHFMGVVNLLTLGWPSTPVIKHLCEDSGPENQIRTE